MININYQHKIAPGFESILIQKAMAFFRMKKKAEKKLMTNSFAEGPANIPKSLSKNFNIQEVKQNTRKVWTISPEESKSDIIILYLHGGGYMANISRPHWDLVEQIIKKTSATILIPDYPLAPEASCIETYDFIQDLYAKLTNDHPFKRIIFIGDSAGGGLALGFAQKLRNEHKKQPDDVILLSPWLDLTMTNPDLHIFDKNDEVLSIEGLKIAGQKYAGNLDLKDYRVSPIYGDFIGLCRISIFTSTNDLLYADSQKCKQLLKNQSISLNYFEYPEMFHDWVIITRLKESKDAIEKIVNLVNEC